MLTMIRAASAIAMAFLFSIDTLAQDKSVTSSSNSSTASVGTTASTATSPAPELKIIDVQPGTGRQAETGRAAMVHYTGWLYDDKAPDKKGKQFDSSIGRGLPFGFVLGVGKVIKGWDQGVVGMKVGGKRTLIIPPQLAYGERDVGGGLIPANSTLVFDIELIEVKP